MYENIRKGDAADIAVFMPPSDEAELAANVSTAQAVLADASQSAVEDAGRRAQHDRTYRYIWDTSRQIDKLRSAMQACEQPPTDADDPVSTVLRAASALVHAESATAGPARDALLDAVHQASASTSRAAEDTMRSVVRTTEQLQNDSCCRMTVNY